MRIERAQIKDARKVYEFIRGLAEYDGLLEEFHATEDDIRRDLFGSSPKAEALIADLNDEPIGIAFPRSS